MATKPAKLDLAALSESIRGAREAKGWTGQRLSHELRHVGFPISQNKLWRLENMPPERIDTELLLWLEKVLGVELIDFGERRQVLIEDVLELLDRFTERAEEKVIPSVPRSGGLEQIHGKLVALVRAAAG